MPTFPSKAVPLLKFPNETAALAPEGMDLIRKIPGSMFPVILMGDGRAGKSYLASRLLGLEDGEGFESSDSPEPVTEGIDMLVKPLAPILAELGADEKQQKEAEKMCLVVLDCEGGNNAMAAIRTLVNVFGMVIGTEVVFVAGLMASEQAIQNLAASLAARSLIRLDESSKLPEQRLVFVVNKNTLTYGQEDFEKMLNQPQTDPARQEIRNVIRSVYSNRCFLSIPLMGTPNFEDAVSAFRSTILEAMRPLTLGNTKVKAKQLCNLLKLIVEEMQKANEVSFPSMNRCVVLDGFIRPLAEELFEEARAALPQLTAYDPDLVSKDIRGHILEKFDGGTSHITQRALVQEARDEFSVRLDEAWATVEKCNTVFGDQVSQVTTEMREVLVSSRQEAFGSGALLSDLRVTKEERRIERRNIVVRKRGGEPECGEWEDTGTVATRHAQTALDSVPTLSTANGFLKLHITGFWTSILTFGTAYYEEVNVVVMNGFMAWWKSKKPKPQEVAVGCLNFLVHHAAVTKIKGQQHCFKISPSSQAGWAESSLFPNGRFHAFVFNVAESGMSSDEWVEVLQKNIAFGATAGQQLGIDYVISTTGVGFPTFAQMEGTSMTTVMHPPKVASLFCCGR